MNWLLTCHDCKIEENVSNCVDMYDFFYIHSKHNWDCEETKEF